MIAADLIAQVCDAGGQIMADGADLVLSAPGPLPADLLDQIRAHKAELLAELAQPDPPGVAGEFIPRVNLPCDAEIKAGLKAALARIQAEEHNAGMAATEDFSQPDVTLWWRVSITEPSGRTIESDTPSGWTLGEWQAYAAHYHGARCAVTPIAELPKPRAPVNLDEAIRAACDGVAGISPEVFRSLLSPEDLQDIEAGDIHRKSLGAYALSFAEGMRSGRIGVPGGEP